eukprot:jgi/Chrzof1/7713/Cz02g33260.t1
MSSYHMIGKGTTPLICNGDNSLRRHGCSVPRAQPCSIHSSKIPAPASNVRDLSFGISPFTAASSRGSKLVARFTEERADERAEQQEGDPSQLPSPSPLGAVSVPVNIVLCKHCSFGESLALVGDVPELGDWDTNKAVQLQWNEGDLWTATVSLPVGHEVSFKYIKLKDDDVVEWGADLAAGNNLSVRVEVNEDAFAGYTVAVDPVMSTAQSPYLVVTLDQSAISERSADFKELNIREASGVPPTPAPSLETNNPADAATAAINDIIDQQSALATNRNSGPSFADNNPQDLSDIPKDLGGDGLSPLPPLESEVQAPEMLVGGGLSPIPPLESEVQPPEMPAGGSKLVSANGPDTITVDPQMVIPATEVAITEINAETASHGGLMAEDQKDPNAILVPTVFPPKQHKGSGGAPPVIVPGDAGITPPEAKVASDQKQGVTETRLEPHEHTTAIPAAGKITREEVAKYVDEHSPPGEPTVAEIEAEATIIQAGGDVNKSEATKRGEQDVADVVKEASQKKDQKKAVQEGRGGGLLRGVFNRFQQWQNQLHALKSDDTR